MKTSEITYSIRSFPKMLDSINKGQYTYEIWKKRPQFSYPFAVVVVNHKYKGMSKVLNTFETEQEARNYLGL